VLRNLHCHDGLYARVRRFFSVLALLAGIYLATAATAAAANKKAIWGPVRLPDGSSAFPVYRDLGVRFLQLQLHWNEIAPRRPSHLRDPTDPAYNWPPEVAEAIRMGRRYGIKIALMPWRSPSWANGGRSPEWAPKNRHYAGFVKAASRRYRSVRHWMIWGEANRQAVFKPLPIGSPRGPRRYATLLRTAYRSLKQRSEKNVVIGGMTFSFGNEVMPGDFIRWMRLPNGKPPPLDLYGHNPFSTRFPDISVDGFPGSPASRDICDLDMLYRDLRRIYRGQYRQFRRRGPRLWVSEYTISSDRGNRFFDFYTTREGQANYLRAAFDIARRSSFIAAFGWIGLLDDPASDPLGATFGLMTHEGERKPAYYAYRRAR
jgi:hypothetical protein